MNYQESRNSKRVTVGYKTKNVLGKDRGMMLKMKRTGEREEREEEKEAEWASSIFIPHSQ